MTKRHAAILLAILNSVSIAGAYVDDVAEIKRELKKEFQQGELQ